MEKPESQLYDRVADNFLRYNRFCENNMPKHSNSSESIKKKKNITSTRTHLCLSSSSSARSIRNRFMLSMIHLCHLRLTCIEAFPSSLKGVCAASTAVFGVTWPLAASSKINVIDLTASSISAWCLVRVLSRDFILADKRGLDKFVQRRVCCELLRKLN